jgi:sugar (pentulose or hexulose) kinase
MKYSAGVDVGSTQTKAVIIDEKRERSAGGAECI